MTESLISDLYLSYVAELPWIEKQNKENKEEITYLSFDADIHSFDVWERPEHLFQYDFACRWNREMNKNEEKMYTYQRSQ